MAMRKVLYRPKVFDKDVLLEMNYITAKVLELLLGVRLWNIVDIFCHKVIME